MYIMWFIQYLQPNLYNIDKNFISIEILIWLHFVGFFQGKANYCYIHLIQKVRIMKSQVKKFLVTS